MPKRKLRIVRKGDTILAVCERCGAEFGQMAVTYSPKIQAAFDAHKCISLDSSQNALRVVREATENK
jgi:ubiquinone/menaquinone biosynthesis C-methylase UbiE